MKVEELIGILGQYPSDDEVVIRKNVKHFVGGQPYFEIRYLNTGIDWDTGKVFIVPMKKYD